VNDCEVWLCTLGVNLHNDELCDFLFSLKYKLKDEVEEFEIGGVCRWENPRHRWMDNI
jgi:hypothetical protein